MEGQQGAQDQGVLLFTEHRLAMNQHRLGPASAALIGAGQALIELVAVCDASHACLAQDAIEKAARTNARVCTGGIIGVADGVPHIYDCAARNLAPRWLNMWWTGCAG